MNTQKRNRRSWTETRVKRFSRIYLGLALCLFGANSFADAPGEFGNGASGSMLAGQTAAANNAEASANGALRYGYPAGDVSVSYNAHNGWQVGATSIISRSSRFGLPSYTSQDVFLLDGQALVCGSNCNTGNDRVYHTRLENYQRIVFKNADSVNSYWEITDKNGTVSRYGSSADSRIDAVNHPDNAPRAWVVAEQISAGGFDVKKFTYTQANGQFYLQKVISGKSGASHFKCTALSYEWLPQQNRRTSYAEGSKVTTEFYVTDVKELMGCDANGTGGQQVVRHELSWETAPNTKVRRVTAITKHGSAGGALPPITFDYHNQLANNTPMFQAAQNWGNPEGPNNTDALREYSGSDTHAELMDMDGNGLPDRVRKKETEDFKIWFNTGSGFTASAANWGNPKGDAIREGKNTKADLIDMNGDGLLDRVRKDDNESMVVLPGNGNGFNSSDGCGWGNPEGNLSENLEIRVSVNGQNEHTNTPWGTIADLIDLNGDGLPDRVYKNINSSGGGHYSGNQHFKVWLNTGCGFGSLQDWGSPEESLGEHANIRHTASTSTTSYELIDINGDGLPDRLRKKPGEALYVWLNTGNGFEATHRVWGNLDNSGALRHSAKVGDYNYTYKDLIDINGDGLPDRLRKYQNTPNNGSAYLYVRFNTGNGFATEEQVWADSGNSYLSAVGSNEASIAMIDVNGDRMPDRVTKCESSCVHTDFAVQLNNMLPSELLLAAVNNGRGGTTHYEYEPLDIGISGNNVGYGKKHWVLSSSTMDDGLGNSGTPAAARTTHYSYHGGYYNRGQRTDYGFAVVKTMAPTGDVSEQHFYQSWDKLGKLKKTVTRQGFVGGRIHSMAYYSYTNHNNGGNYAQGISQARPGFGPNLTVDAPLLTAKQTYVVSGSTSTDLGSLPLFEGDGFYRLKTTSSYDTYGNLTNVVNWGEVDPQTGSDIGIDKETSVTAWAINSNDWIMKPSQLTKTEWNKSGYATSFKTQYYYDDLALGDVGSSGLLTRQTHYSWLTSHFDTTKSYDNYGNLETDTNGRGFTTSYGYDNSYHSFLKTTTRQGELAQPFVTTNNYDGLMRLQKVIDFNGNATEYRYDQFSRLSKKIRPGDSVQNPTENYVYGNYSHSMAPAYREIRRKNSTTSQLVEREYQDGFGRLIQTKVQQQNSISNPTVTYRTNSFWHYVDGNAKVQWSSFAYNTPTTAFSRGVAPSNHESDTRVYLDASSTSLGKVTAVTNAANNTRYKREYHFTVDTLNEKGQVKRNFSVAKSKVRYETEFTGVFPNHSFYSQGRFYDRSRYKTVQDNNGKGNEYFYNLLGLNTKLVSADRGTWTYGYDTNKNLIRETDALGDATMHVYDALDRIKTTTYADGSKIEYYYDGDNNRDGQVDSGFAGMLGQLTYVTDTSGYTKLYYDARGRVTHENKHINGISNRNTLYQYDSLDRLTGIRYPGETTYSPITYDLAGKPYSLGLANGNAIVEATQYNTRGALSVIQMPANKIIRSYYSQNELWRLQQVASIKRSNNRELLSFGYGYDEVGNISTINAKVNGVASPTHSRSFSYDALNRLTGQTNSSYVGGSESFTYNTIGNVTNHNGSSYAYATNHPHGVIRIGSNGNFAYDANGNATKFGNRAISYYKSHMPASIGGESYLYDYTGTRVKKSSASGDIYYLNRYYELDHGKNVRNYYLGSQLVAKTTNGNVQWLHGDLLDSTYLITDSSGNGVREQHYKSYGGTAEVVGSNTGPQEQFTGQKLDGTGLYYYGSRYYAAGAGRFIQPDTVIDPTAHSQQANLYTYVANNPVRYRDPSGHSAEEGAGDICLECKPVVRAEPTAVSITISGGSEGNNGGLNMTHGSSLGQATVSNPQDTGDSTVQFGTWSIGGGIDNTGFNVGADINANAVYVNPTEGDKFTTETGLTLGGYALRLSLNAEEGLVFEFGASGPAVSVGITHQASNAKVGVTVGTGLKITLGTGNPAKWGSIPEDVKTTYDANAQWRHQNSIDSIQSYNAHATYYQRALDTRPSNWRDNASPYTSH